MKSKDEIKQLVNLVNRAKLHDKEAFTELVQLYLKDLYKTAIAILMNDEDAADAIQETLLICWDKINQLKNEKYYKTWMIRILINNCYAIRSKHSKELPVEQVTVDEYIEPMEEKDNEEEFREILSVLDEKYRLPLYLFYGQKYKIVEIAKILGVPKSTIQTRLARGRKQLAKYYDSKTGE